MADKNQEDANKEYLKNILGGDNQEPNQPNQPELGFEELKNDVSVTDDLHYTNVIIEDLPSGRFYKTGTKIKIRAAKVSEVQAFSVVDDKNFMDVTDKMNELLSRCVIYIFPNGGKGTYKDLKDGDRIFLTFMIRELTFQGGNTLTKPVQCTCNHKFEIPFRATSGKAGKATFVLHEQDEKIERFFKPNECAYEIVNNGVSWKVAPPTIGIQESFYDEIKRNVQSDLKPNVSFMKMTPFLLYDRSSITEEGISSKLEDFDKMNDLKLSQVINTLINNMTVGIKELKTECPECGSEVRTPLTFPNGASTLFDLPNILDEF